MRIRIRMANLHLCLCIIYMMVAGGILAIGEPLYANLCMLLALRQTYFAERNLKQRGLDT